MKTQIRTIVVALIASLLLGAVLSAGAASLGVNFIGRGANSSATAGYPLSPTDVAGQVAQPNWNNVDTGQSTFDGSVSFLNSDAGDFTSVSLTYEANDSWASDGTTATPDEILMKGTLKLATTNYNVDALILTITNLPAGTFDVLVYFSNDGTGSSANVEVGGPTKYYLNLENVFSGSFIRATATTAGAAVTANYAQFNAVPSVGGKITISARQTGPGNTSIGINAVQLVQVSGTPWSNTQACSITTNPAPATVATGNSATFTVGASAPSRIQWQKNTVDIPGATGATYTTPPTVAGDAGALFRAVVYNNVNTNTSANALLTLVPPVQTQGFMKVEQWQNIGDTIGAIGLDELIAAMDAGGPTASYFVAGANVPPTNPNLDSFGAKVSGWFIPSVSGDYSFFLRGDSSSRLYFNPTPAAGSGPNALPPVTTTTYVAEQVTPSQPFQEGGFSQSGDFPLVAGKLYGLVAIYKDGTGGDFLQVAARLSTDPTPAADLKPISSLYLTTLASSLGQTATITTQPQSITVTETRPAKFTVAATTAPTAGLFGVQWRKNGTPIPGAIANTLSFNNTPISDDGALISASVYTLAGVLTSSNALLHVVPDTFAPIAAAAAITQTLPGGGSTIQVGITFDEAVNRATLVAGNFTLNGGTATFTLATNSLDTYVGVLLTNATGLTAGGSYTVTVKNVADLKGNAITTTNVPFTLGQIGWADVGIPPRPSQVVPVGADGFDILNGGRTEWATYDEVALVYVKKTNDFDVKLQVIYAEPSSQWGRVGLQARNALDAGVPPTSPPCANPEVGTNTSAYAQTHVNPNQTLGGSGVWDPNDPLQPGTAANNGHEQNCRLDTGAATTGWGSGLAGPPTYPNVWLRLKRVGTNITGFSSEDGVTWLDQGSVSLTAQTNVMYIGPSLSAETGNLGWGAGHDVYCAPFNPVYDRLFLASYRNFSDVITDVPPSNPTIAKVGANVVVTWTTGVLQSSLSLTTPGSFTDVVGATSPYSTPATGGPKYFRVRSGTP